MESINNSQKVTSPVTPDINPNPPPPYPQKKKGKLGVIISLLIILLLLSTSGVAGYFIYKNTISKPQEVACTIEAKICPDGSSVGRTGSNCEFAPCPTLTPDPMADWRTVSLNDSSVVFSYPSSWNVSETQKSEFGNYFIDLKGSDSEIQLTWDGEGYGGGCSIEDKREIKILGNSYDLCHSHSETNEYISVIFQLDNGTPISFSSTVKPNSADVNTIYQILSTFKFTD